MQYPVKEVKLPKDLKGIENGKLTPDMLVDIKPSGKMHKLAAQAWEAMRQAAKADGYSLCHVGAYRPFEDQLALFKERYVKGDSGDPRKITRTWKGEVYMLKPKYAPAGSPGSSNHGWGLAIDAALLVDGKITQITTDPDGKKGPLDSGLDWLMENADKFGYSWEIKEGAQAEAWHIRYYPGDAIPAAVQEFLTGKSGAAPVQAASVAAPAAAPAEEKKKGNPTPNLKRGDKGNPVKRFQEEMVKDGFQMKVDGDFGPATEKLVREFRKKHGLPDGVTVDAGFWEVLLK